MTRHTVSIGVLGAYALIALMSCSSDSSLAGSSGAGNPGSTVALSLRATDSCSAQECALSKTLHAAKGPAREGELAMVDAKGLVFLVDSAWVHLSSIRFVFQDPIPADNRFWTSHPDVLWSAEAAVVTGPFSFDAITGNSTISDQNIVIPATSYSVVQLWFTPSAHDKRCGVVLVGHFDYKNKIRNFRFELKIDSPMVIRHPALTDLGSPSEAARDIAIVLDAAVWLDSIDISNGIARKELPLTPEGNLVIDTRSGAQAALYAHIVRNFLRSAR